MYNYQYIKRAAAVMLAALLCVLVLGSCGKKDDGTGKVINFTMTELPEKLDPAIASSSTELAVVNNCFEGLVRQDASGKIVPAAASRWTASPDGRTLTFTLRQDNRWRLHEDAKELLGEAAFAAFDTQVTAADFVYGMQRSLNPATHAPNATLLYAIQNASAVRSGQAPPNTLGVRAEGRFTVVFTLEQASSAFLYALTQSVAMPCNQAYFNATAGRYGLAPEYLLCNGPFYLKREKDNQIRLAPNAGYTAAEGSVLPAQVDIWCVEEEDRRVSQLGVLYDAAIVSEKAAAQAPEGVIKKELHNTTLALVFQCKSLPEVNVRAAMCAALEPSIMGYSVLPGLLPDGETVGSDNYRALAGQPKGIAYDINRANALVSGKTAEAVRLRLISVPEHEQLLRRALQGWQRIFRMKLEATIEALEPEDFQKRLDSGDFDVAITTLRTEHSDALKALQTLAGKDSLPRYQSNILDGLLSAAAKTASAAEAARACLQAEEHLLQNGVYYPLERGRSSLLLAPGVEGLIIAPAGDQIFFGQMKKYDQ